LLVGFTGPVAGQEGLPPEPPRFTLADLQGEGPLGRAWLSCDLRPITFGPAFAGTIRALNFTVRGDHERIEWQTAPGAPVRTFARREAAEVAGVQLSVFDVSFPARELRRLGPMPIRFDKRLGPFRLRPSTIAKAPVVRIDDRVQYSSHVVNIVAGDDCYPGAGCEGNFHEVLPRGDRIFDPSEVARIFYEHFTDSYEQLALVSERVHSSPDSGASGLGAYSDVEGINWAGYDWRSYWSGSEVLLGAIAHLRVGLMSNWVSLHESGHQWGFRWDLFDVAGVEAPNAPACDSPGHAPLMADRVSLMSHCLNVNDDRYPNLRIARRGDEWVLAAPERPLTYHPLQLYAMGLLSRDEVPSIWLRLRQDRPRPMRPGTRVPGEFVEVTMDDIIARYGERSGPAVPSILRRAYIVVSPQRLMSARDLSWFNFFARRLSDPDVTGIEDLDLTPSTEFATLGLVDLRTEIRPRTQPQVAGEFAVSYPKVGRGDLVGLRLDRPLGTRYQVGRAYVVAGRVKVDGSHSEVRIRLGSREFSGEIGADRRFAVTIAADAEDRGPQVMSIALGRPYRLIGHVAPVQVE
jgi:hypothetical protein